MKRRIIISILLCVAFFFISSRFFVLKWKLTPAQNNSGLNTSSFAPSEVIKVPGEDDIIVNVYPSVDPSVGIPPPDYDGMNSLETNLNNIKKGWIVAQYNGNCRLLFDIAIPKLRISPLFTPINTITTVRSFRSQDSK